MTGVATIKLLRIFYTNGAVYMMSFRELFEKHDLPREDKSSCAARDRSSVFLFCFYFPVEEFFILYHIGAAGQKNLEKKSFIIKSPEPVKT